MSDTDKHHPDKTPVFGLDDLEAPAVSAGRVDSSPLANTHEPRPVEGDGLSIVLHDKLSGVHLLTDKFPVEIGNGRRFNMALRGPGPDGLYARIEKDAGGLAIECCHQRVFMAVDMVEAPRHRLIGPVSIQLGDHLISFDFSNQVPAKPRRKRPKWAILVAAVLLVLGLFLLQFLLVADEAESRVTVVAPANQQGQTTAVDDLPTAEDQEQALETVVALPVSLDAELSEPAPEQVVEAPQAGGERKVLGPAPLSVFFSITRALPVMVESELVDVQTEPTTSSSRVPVVKDAKPTIIERYQRGETIMMTDASPALKMALSAIRDFYDSETLNMQMSAWETLVAAEKELGLGRPSTRREQIRAALGDTLSMAAAEQAVLDNARQAYAFYYRAAGLGHESVQGRQLMAALDAKAARLYRFGYRLKYTDPSTAGHYWFQVMDEVPSQSEWHRKATLALNETKGVRG